MGCGTRIVHKHSCVCCYLGDFTSQGSHLRGVQHQNSTKRRIFFADIIDRHSENLAGTSQEKTCLQRTGGQYVVSVVICGALLADVAS